METQTADPMIDSDIKPLSDEQIIKERQAFNPGQMEAADSDIIPSPDTPVFNDMASKLEKAMSEVRNKKEPSKDANPAAVEQKQEKKTEPPKEPTTAPQEDAEPRNITSAKAADWKVLKEKLKVAEAAKAELEQKFSLTNKEYEEFRKKAVDMSKVEEVTKNLQATVAERDKFKNDLETVALERSEAFTRQFDERFSNAITQAKEAAGEHAEKVEHLLRLTPSKWRKERINEIRETLAGVDQGQLDIAISEFDRATTDRTTQLKNSKENYQRLIGLQAERSNREKELKQHQLKAMTVAALDMARQKFESFKTGETPEQKARAEANEKRMERFFMGQLEGDELYSLPIKAAEHDRIKEVMTAKEKEILELKESLKKYQGTETSPSGGQRVAPSTSAPENNESPFIAAYNRAMRQG